MSPTVLSIVIVVPIIEALAIAPADRRRDHGLSALFDVETEIKNMIAGEWVFGSCHRDEIRSHRLEWEIDNSIPNWYSV